MSLRQHHSFVRLPDDGYRPRAHDPRVGFFPISFADCATLIDAPLTRPWIRRHRLRKKHSEAAVSEPVRPIVYYLDPGVPEPVRSALLEGAAWWNDAFAAAGFRDAFRVEMLPAGADPLDVRYNMVQWVHRATAVGIGSYDKWAIRWAYSEFSPGDGRGRGPQRDPCRGTRWPSLPDGPGRAPGRRRKPAGEPLGQRRRPGRRAARHDADPCARSRTVRTTQPRPAPATGDARGDAGAALPAPSPPARGRRQAPRSAPADSAGEGKGVGGSAWPTCS